MYQVELYVGYSDKTWGTVIIYVTEEVTKDMEPEEWAINYFNDNFDKEFKSLNRFVAFVGVYHIEHMETTE